MDVVGLEVWRYHILLYCDLMSLLRVNWLNRRLRQLLNTAEFVVEYQSVCWYLQPRYCACKRNLFYLDASQFLDFSYDYSGIPDSEDTPEVCTVRDVSQYLRRIGRTPDMLVQSFQRSGGNLREPLVVSEIDPRTSPAYTEGFTKMWIDASIIPMPRVVDHPVEDRRVQDAARLMNDRLPTETLEEHEHRIFWREFHEVTDEMVYEVEIHKTLGREHREHGFRPAGPDLVEEWKDYCQMTGANPHDPLYDDEECRGFRCIRWARSKMHESAVGGGSYPLELCLHRDDLRRTAGRLGVDYLDRMYVHLNRYRGGSPEWNTIGHRGVLYFMGVRYENESEDFSNWALNTQALMHGVYAHMWLDALVNWTRLLMQHLHALASQAEEDLRFSGLQLRWRYLHSLCFAGPSVRPPNEPYTQRAKDRDQAAVHLIFNNHFLEENRYLSNLVEHGDAWTNVGDIGQRSRHFLTGLLEHYDHPTPNHRTESQRVQDAYRLIRFAEYLTDFAEYVGPRVDDRTLVTRRRALRIYLSSFVSLVAFGPGWKRTYHWKPSRTNETTHWHVPHINLQHNHRFRRYLDFCNRRALHYHPDPSLLWNHADTDATQGWRG